MNDDTTISPTLLNSRKKRVFQRLNVRYWKPLIQTFYPDFQDWSSVVNFKTGSSSPATSIKVLEMMENIADAIDEGRTYLNSKTTVNA